MRHVAHAAPTQAPQAASPTTASKQAQVTAGVQQLGTGQQLAVGLPGANPMRLRVTRFRRIMAYSGKNGGY